MTMAERNEDEIAQVAWLYYVGGLSQQQVSERLGISRFKVLRMLAEARDVGMVRVSVEHRTAAMLALADRLVARFGLIEARVAPAPGAAADDAYRRVAVGILAADYLMRVAAGDRALTVGIGWGRTLSAMADHIAGVRNANATFVSLMGSVVHASRTAPGDVCIRLAAQFGARAVLMPAPFIADTPEDCAAIMRQRLVREALQVARVADIAVMSVGECRDGAILFEGDIFSEEQIDALRAADVVGDCCGVFFRQDGSVADIALNRCTPCVKPQEMAAMDTLLLAGGLGKLPATLAVLRAGFVRRLFVDEGLARELLAVGP